VQAAALTQHGRHGDIGGGEGDPCPPGRGGQGSRRWWR
jgi:hypothetical protein